LKICSIYSIFSQNKKYFSLPSLRQKGNKQFFGYLGLHLRNYL